LSRRPRRSDHFTRWAKQQNYPARSIFKLKEIDEKTGLIRPGDSVLDLGCAPGSWLQYASQRVGESGIVVGVDRHGLKIPLPKNARYLALDALALTREDLAAAYPGHFDVVLSDMAPHTSGNRFVDQQRSLRLFQRALEIAREHLKLGGSFIGKIFQSEDVDALREEVRASFSVVKTVRPQATRKQSYEVYIVCQRHRRVESTPREPSPLE
jgi:23S rRNA (uridine2552-2'-O)-methyltransferase